MGEGGSLKSSFGYETENCQCVLKSRNAKIIVVSLLLINIPVITCYFLHISSSPINVTWTTNIEQAIVGQIWFETAKPRHRLQARLGLDPFGGKQTNRIRGQSPSWDTVSLTQHCVHLWTRQSRDALSSMDLVGRLCRADRDRQRLHGEQNYTTDDDDGMDRDIKGRMIWPKK